jgi:hypothetical protein
MSPHYPDSEPTSLCSFSLMLHAYRRSNKYQFYSLWFDKNKSANQKQELSVAAMFVNGSGQNVHSLERTFNRCFLPSFSSFGGGVSEEKIKM